MSITRKDLGIDPLTGIQTFQIVDEETGKVLGYDHVAPEE